MSANSILLWAIAGAIGLSGAMMLIAPDPPVTSLENSLGPDVVSEPL